MPASSHTEASKPKQISILPLLTVNFVGTLGFSIVLPFLFYLVTRWGGNAILFGFAGATYSFFQLIGAPILGRWSDKFGRQRILLLSQFGTLVSWLILLAAFALPETTLLNVDSTVFGRFAISLPLIFLFVARAADGLTGGNVSVANAYLADITEESQRSERFGKMAVSGNLGFVIGPALAGILGATVLGEILPVMAAALISAVATVLVMKLPESNPCILKNNIGATTIRKVFGQEPRECYQLKGAEQVSLRRVLTLRYVPSLLLMYFLVMLGFNFFYVTFPVHAVEVLKWSVTDTGTFFAVMSVMMVIVQGPVLKAAAARWRDIVLVPTGALLLAVSFLFFLRIDTISIYSGTAFLAIGNGLMWPSLVSILSRVAGKEFQGTVQGIAGSCGAVASVLGLLVAGILYNSLGNLLFVFSAATIFLTFVVSLRLLSKVDSARTPAT